MNLNFLINEKILFYEALIRGVDKKNWVGLQDELWEKHRKGYEFLQGNLYKTLLSNNVKKYLSGSCKEAEILLKEGLDRPEFKELLHETKEYKKWLENEWYRNKTTVVSTLKDILRIEFPEDEVKVIVVSNKMKGGLHIDKGFFIWGHPENWPNYSMVYLAHEYLHDILGKSDLEHAIIELATDNELRIRLNGEGKYFHINGALVGHESLFKLEKKLYANWQKYLKNSNINIFDFINSHTEVSHN